MVDRANQAVEAWAKMGYRTLVYQDLGSTPCQADVVQMGRFTGYYRIINGLVETAFCEGADLVTCASDDMRPDPETPANEIAAMYLDRFPEADGVLQATGDPQGKDEKGRPAAARICGSPAFGRGWVMRAYQGEGPFHSGYRSYFADEELYEVAKREMRLWQEPNLKIDHLHWSWGRMKKQQYHNIAQLNWECDRELFQERKAQGFPGSKML